jgi:prepilin-type N-terminal cleavage/methylation domain-containing protein
MGCRSRSRRGRRGFTLIEVFLAATIVSVGFIGVAGAFSYAAKVSRLANDTVVAEQLVSDVLAQARSRGTANLTGWYTYPLEQDTSGLEHDCSVMLAQSGLPQAEAWLTVTDVAAGLKGVCFEVHWGTAPPKGRAGSETLISDRF